MFRFHIVAGTLFAFIAVPAPAQEASSETTGAISRETLPEVGQAGQQQSPLPAQLSDHSTAAQQFGNLAASKGTSSLVGDLGDVMVLLNSQINHRLRAHGTIGEEDQKRLNELAETNEGEFAIGLANWITDTYPEAIKGWKDAQSGGLQELASAVIPQLEAQLMVAQKIIEAGGNLAARDEQVRNTLSWGGGDQEGKVAEQFRLEPRGDAAAGGNVAD